VARLVASPHNPLFITNLVAKGQKLRPALVEFAKATDRYRHTANEGCAARSCGLNIQKDAVCVPSCRLLRRPNSASHPDMTMGLEGQRIEPKVTEVPFVVSSQAPLVSYRNATAPGGVKFDISQVRPSAICATMERVCTEGTLAENLAPRLHSWSDHGSNSVSRFHLHPLGSAIGLRSGWTCRATSSGG